MAFEGNETQPLARQQATGPLPNPTDYNTGDTAWLVDQKQAFRNVDINLTREWDAIGPLERVQPFSFSDGTIPLQIVRPGSQCSRVLIAVLVPFDDPAATMSVGTAGSPSLLMGALDSYLANVAQYEDPKLTVFVVTDTLQITINPGVSTQGSGFVLYQYKGVPG